MARYGRVDVKENLITSKTVGFEMTEMNAKSQDLELHNSAMLPVCEKESLRDLSWL